MRLLVFCGQRSAIERFDAAGWPICVAIFGQTQKSEILAAFRADPNGRLAVDRTMSTGWRAPHDTFVLFDPSWPFNKDDPHTKQATMRRDMQPDLRQLEKVQRLAMSFDTGTKTFARNVDPAAINFILEHPQPMTESEAQDYAPQWGSYIRNGDPGSVMYSAIPPERAEHRDEMISYIRLHCLPIASQNEDPEDIEKLKQLIAYLQCLTY